jgi:ketosteroid isomerase-like protein
MSRENVEIVRQVFDAVARGDRERVLALYHSDIEMEASPGTFVDEVLGPLHRGHDGLRALNRELHQAFETLETPCEELIDAGERVISSSRYLARGRESGIDIEGPVEYGVWTIREGKVARVTWFRSRQEALDAVGLSE